MLNRAFPPSTTQKTVYSVEWAASIVEKLENTYPRATEAVYRQCGLDTHIMAVILASGRPEWQQIKDFIHEVDKRIRFMLNPWNIDKPEYLTENDLVGEVLSKRQKKMPENLYRFLTKRLVWIQ